MERSWADEALALIRRGEPLALITLTDVQGSAPGEPGARMLVWADGQNGTIGGGNLEFKLTQDARALLARGDGAQTSEYPLGPIPGQCCGGRVAARIERLDTASIARLEREARAHNETQAPLYLFGAGHVGQAIARATAPLPFRLCWFDTRPEFCSEATLTGDPREDVARAPAGAFVLVVTHDHDLDYEIVRAVLARSDGRYCGLIGSKAKRGRFARRLRADGLGDELPKLTCPIGDVIGLRGKAPAIIAAATIAEMLLVLEAQPADAREPAHAE
jgi:xanthine dehydrogenase accessory factor